MARRKDEAVVTYPSTIEGEPRESPPAPPKATDPEWNDYVLSHFLPAEKDPEGNPTADGLRRVAELLLGPIMDLDVDVLNVPTRDNGHYAAAKCRVEIAFREDQEWDAPRTLRSFSGAADVYEGNTDPMFLRHAVASVSTKAEAIALRKALKLRKVYASEELTKVPLSESGIGPEMIQPHQVSGLLKTCNDLAIDPLAFINMGKKTYRSIEEVSRESAVEMFRFINEYLRDPGKIPANIRKEKNA